MWGPTTSAKWGTSQAHQGRAWGMRGVQGILCAWSGGSQGACAPSALPSALGRLVEQGQEAGRQDAGLWSHTLVGNGGFPEGSEAGGRGVSTCNGCRRKGRLRGGWGGRRVHLCSLIHGSLPWVCSEGRDRECFVSSGQTSPPHRKQSGQNGVLSPLHPLAPTSPPASFHAVRPESPRAHFRISTRTPNKNSHNHTFDT